MKSFWSEFKIWLVAALLVGALAMAFPLTGSGSSDIPEETAQPCIWVFDESECDLPGTVTPPTPVTDDGDEWLEEGEVLALPDTGSGATAGGAVFSPQYVSPNFHHWHFQWAGCVYGIMRATYVGHDINHRQIYGTYLFNVAIGRC